MDYPVPPAEKGLFSQLLGLWQPSAVRPLGYGLRCRVPSGFPGGSVVKNPPARQEPRQTGSIPGLGRSPKEGNGYPLQYSYLENSMDREA